MGYNLKEANKSFIKSGAFLARDMGFHAERKPMGIKAQRRLEQRIDRWREGVMRLIQQHQAAHRRIAELEAANTYLSQLCANYRNQLRKPITPPEQESP